MALRSRLAWQSSQAVRTRSRSWRRAAYEYGTASFGDTQDLGDHLGSGPVWVLIFDVFVFDIDSES
jgi:hypothetical protein